MSEINNELALKEETEKVALAFLETFTPNKKLQENEKKLFIGICKEMGLNPFKREIHVVAYGSGEYRTLNIITGYEVYLKRAEASGKLEHWSIETQGDRPDTNSINKARESNLKAIIKIKVKNRPEFVHEVFFAEYFQMTKTGGANGQASAWEVNSMWKNKPVTMLKKVCIGQGFRLAFPLELSAMPYLEEENVNLLNSKIDDELTESQETIVIQKPKTKEEAMLNKPVVISLNKENEVFISVSEQEEKAKKEILEEEKKLAEQEKLKV